MTVIEKLQRIIENAKGDGLYRAECAFRGMSDPELDMEYGQSGKTRRQVLEDYRQERRDWEAVKALVDIVVAFDAAVARAECDAKFAPAFGALYVAVASARAACDAEVARAAVRALRTSPDRKD